MKTYSGSYSNGVNDLVVIVVSRGKNGHRRTRLLSPSRSLRYVNHSPTGFSWGYGGSGPAQLAFALLLDATNSARIASRFYQKFKREKVANFSQTEGFSVTNVEIVAWLNEQDD